MSSILANILVGLLLLGLIALAVRALWRNHKGGGGCMGCPGGCSGCPGGCRAPGKKNPPGN